MYSPDSVIHNANRVTKIDLKKVSMVLRWFAVRIDKRMIEILQGTNSPWNARAMYLGIDVSCWITSANQMQGKQLSFVRYSLASFYIIRHF